MQGNQTNHDTVSRPSLLQMLGEMWTERSHYFLINNLFNDFFWLGFALGVLPTTGLLILHLFLGNKSIIELYLSYPFHIFMLLLPPLTAAFFSVLGSAVSHLFQRMREDNIHDYLTGLYGHRYFRDELRDRMAEAKRYQYPLSVVIFDLDHFKEINDQYGHPTGDEVLKTIAELMQSSSRSSDVVCRYGGEEFVIILPHTKKSGAVNVAERIRRAIGSHRFEESFSVTVSGGVSQYPADGETENELINIADKRLFEAKKSGRDQVFAL